MAEIVSCRAILRVIVMMRAKIWERVRGREDKEGMSQGQDKEDEVYRKELIP